MMIARIATVLIVGMSLCTPGRAEDAAHNTDWLHQAKWGVMTHYLAYHDAVYISDKFTAEMWNARVDAFDVKGLVDQLVSANVKYYMISIGQINGFWCSPNAAYDKIVGIRPSRCSRRDLIADLYKAMEPHGIRLMVYMPSDGPRYDPVAVKKLKWHRPRGGERLAEFQRNWEAVIREWSLRWGRHVHGWWVDGCYYADAMYRFDDEPNFASFAAAIRAGNPDAIVAFNPGVKVPVICWTRHEDYTAGEMRLKQMPDAVRTCPGRWLQRDGHKAQYHILSYLGPLWGRGDKPALPDDQIIEYVRSINEKGGAVTWDVPIRPNGLIPQPFLNQLKALGRSIN